MPTKPWYLSKTIWSDIVTILIAIYSAAQGGLALHLGFNLPVIPVWVFTFLGILGIYGRTTATNEIE